MQSATFLNPFARKLFFFLITFNSSLWNDLKPFLKPHNVGCLCQTRVSPGFVQPTVWDLGKGTSWTTYAYFQMWKKVAILCTHPHSSRFTMSWWNKHRRDCHPKKSSMLMRTQLADIYHNVNVGHQALQGKRWPANRKATKQVKERRVYVRKD